MNSLKKTMIAASCLVLSAVPVTAQTKTTEMNAVPVVVASTPPVSDTRLTTTDVRPTPVPLDRVIVVSLEDRRLALVEDGLVKKVYRVSVGRETTPSPTGMFTIVNRVENPTYYHEGQVVPPGPANPVGTRWIGLDKKGYGIHGTNMPRSIGKAASHGCIRMRRRNLEELFAQVRGGDRVEIVGERNEETAAIFGEPVLPGMTAPPPIVTAQRITEAPAQTTASDAAATAMVPAIVPANR
jgi:lipoprotein-anchoring transpeptidase ErfK/SrfK